MISKEREGMILRLFHAEQWPVGTIATEVGVHHTTVQRVLTSTGVDHCETHPRASIADPYKGFMAEVLEKHPRLRASRLFAMARERGYPGGPDHFRRIVAELRPRQPAEAFLRLRTLPGEQAQVDWGHFGKLCVGDTQRVIWAFVMVLSWSRQVYLRFFFGAAMPAFLRGHIGAFEFFGGVPRVLLYDNLKSVVQERKTDAIHFNPTILALSGHYRFEPRPVAVARGNEKGRVERAIRYIRDSFFAARKFSDLGDLNRQALEWTTGIAADRRCPEDRSRTVGSAFVEERGKLMALPETSFPASERVEVSVGKTPYARFDLNDYSVPSSCVRTTLVVEATLESVRIIDGQTVVATHQRSWDKGQQIEDPSHIAKLIAAKRKAHEHRGFDRLAAAAPTSRKFLEVIAERGGNLGSVTNHLLVLLNTCKPEEMEAAMVEALAHETVHLGGIRHILDRQRAALGAPPPIAPRFSSQRHAGLAVKPHALASYDTIGQPEEDDVNF